MKDATVHQAVTSDLHRAFVTRLSTQAQQEMQQLRVLTAQTVLSDEPGRRQSPTVGAWESLTPQRTTRLQAAEGAKAISGSNIFFHLEKMLLHRGCSSSFGYSSTVESNAGLTCTERKSLPHCGAPEETSEHLILECPIAVSFWAAVGLQLQPGQHIENIHCLSKVNSIHDAQYSSFIALCCWQLWKRRNGIAFCNEAISIPYIS